MENSNNQNSVNPPQAPQPQAGSNPAVPQQPNSNTPTPAPQAQPAPQPAPQPNPATQTPQQPQAQPAPQVNPNQQPQAQPAQNINHPKKGKKGPQLGMGCLVFAVIFVILAILSIVAIIAVGGNQGTLFGIDSAVMINTLKALTTTIFLLISIVLLVVTVVLAFKRSVIPVTDKESRKKSLRNILISAGLLFLSVIIWIGVYLFLSQIKPPVTAKNLITTNPTVVTQLTGPIDVEFDTTLIQQQASRIGLQIAQCEWDFDGDSRIDDAGCRLTHNFDEVGEYPVTLNVSYLRNSVKIEEEDQFKVTVTVENLRPEVKLLASPESGKTPLKVDFDAGASYDPDDANNNIKFEWKFSSNDRYTPGNSTATHTYEGLGTYEATVRVTDNKGATTEVTKTISVIENPDTDIVAYIKTTPDDPTGTVPLQIRFDATQSSSPFGNIKSYSWDFGDGSPSRKGRSVTYVYRTGGEYTVTLTIEDEKGNKAEDTKKVIVENPAVVPQAKITTDQPELRDGQVSYIKGTVPFTVSFSGEDSTDGDDNIISYLWDLDGDGLYDESEGDSIDWTFETGGTITVGLQVIDADNQSTEDTLEVRIDEFKVRPLITTEPTPATGTAPLTVTFDGSGSEYEDGTILSYEWNFDDGTQPVLGDAQITHIFNLVGEYNVEMTAYTDDNLEASTTKRVVVRNVPLKAKIIPSIKHGPAPLTIEFDSSESTGSIKSYSWDFDDNDSSNQVNPVHTFDKPGTYDITLTVTDNANNVAQTSETIIVEQPQ